MADRDSSRRAVDPPRVGRVVGRRGSWIGFVLGFVIVIGFVCL